MIFNISDKIFDASNKYKPKERDRQLTALRCYEIEEVINCPVKLHLTTKPHHVYYVNSYDKTYDNCDLDNLISKDWVVLKGQCKYSLCDFNGANSKLDNWLSKNGNNMNSFVPENAVIFVRTAGYYVEIAFANKEQANNFSKKFPLIS